MKMTITVRRSEEVAVRGQQRGRQMTRGKKLIPVSDHAFDSPRDFLGVLTKERVRLCIVARSREFSVTSLAHELKRDVRAVRADIKTLEKHGLIRLRDKVNPGHGRVRIVETTAEKFYLQAEF
jgi:predicted transcriptional regulator